MKVSLAILPEREVAAIVTAVDPAVMPVAYEQPVIASTPLKLEYFDDAPVFASSLIFDQLAEITPFQWAGIVWAFGVVLFFVVVCFRALQLNRKLHRLRRTAELDCSLDGRGDISVWQIDGIGQPFVWGLFRGSVYVPGNFNECGSVSDRQGIMMHEFAHVRRFDAGVNVLQIFAQGLFWFHPLVWIANTMVRREREKCCDEAAIANLKSPPRDYGNAIIDTLAREYESNMRVPSLAVAGPVKNIEDRLKTIMRPGKKFYKRCGVFALITIVLLAIVALPVGCVLTTRSVNVDNEAIAESDIEIKVGTSDGTVAKDVNSDKKQVHIKFWLIEADEDFLEEVGIDMKILAVNKDSNPDHIRNIQLSNRNGECNSIFDSNQRDLILDAARQNPQAKILATPEVLVYDTQMTAISTVSKIQYISGYEEDVNNPGEFVKKIETLDDGMDLQLRPHLDSDSSDIDLSIDFKMDQLVRLSDATNKFGRTFQLPETMNTKMETRITIPSNMTCLTAVTGLPNPENEQPKDSPDIKYDKCMIILVAAEIVEEAGSVMEERVYEVPVLKSVKPEALKDRESYLGKVAMNNGSQIVDYIKKNIFPLGGNVSKGKSSIFTSNINVISNSTTTKDTNLINSEIWAFEITVVHVPSVHEKIKAYVENLRKEFYSEHGFAKAESEKKADEKAKKTVPVEKGEVIGGGEVVSGDDVLDVGDVRRI